jgi:hypothetical protein
MGEIARPGALNVTLNHDVLAAVLIRTARADRGPSRSLRLGVRPQVPRLPFDEFVRVSENGLSVL